MEIDAVYHEAALPEWRGNPLIEALPAKQDFAQVLPKLSNFPPYDEEERKLPAYLREDFVLRLNLLRLPFPEYKDCFRFVQKGLFESYSTKNPFSPTTNHYLHYHILGETAVAPCSGLFEPNAAAMTIVGVSGVGKSKMLTQIFKYFPQVVFHQYYQGKALPLRQLVWVRVDCPPNSTIKGLCYAILDQIDLALEEPRTAPQSTLDALLVQIEHRIRSVFLGTLVVDELQHIDIAKSGGAEAVISFLLNLINRSGVPVILCGNPDMLKWIRRKFRLARRAEAGGYVEMGPVNPSVWPALINAMWPLQWTNVETPITEELSEKLYNLSAGIPDIAIRVYKTAQELVIGTGDEQITVSVLEESFSRCCVLTIEELGELNRLRDTIPDISTRHLIDADCTANEVGKPRARTSQSIKTDIKETIIPGDLTRPQHPEFADRIRALKTSVNLGGQIESPYLVRSAAEASDALAALKRSGVLMADPSKTLAW